MDSENDNQSKKPEPISPDWVHEVAAEDTSSEDDEVNPVQPGDIGMKDSAGNNEEPLQDTVRVVLSTSIGDDDDAPAVEVSPMEEEITDQVLITPKVEELSTDPVPTGKTAPVVTRSTPASNAVGIDLDEIEESQHQRKIARRFLGMGAGQRFFFFLFMLIIVVVLGTLFLALSGKVSLQFLMGLFS